MTSVLLVAILVVLIGLALILAGVGSERRARDRAHAAAENARLRQLIRSVETEARTQLAAGNATFEYLLTLIGDHREKESV